MVCCNGRPEEPLDDLFIVLDKHIFLCYTTYTLLIKERSTVLVKQFIHIFKKYKEYQKTLKELKEHAHKEDEYLTAEEWSKLYAQEYAEYVRWMNSPLGEVLEDL